MKVKVALIAIAALALVAWALMDRPESPSRSLPVASSSPPTIEPAPTTTEDERAAPGVSDLRQRVVDLEGALSLATARREEAARTLDALEEEVAELEALIEEIEARGEDPVDYAEQGLAQFQPAFFRFQDAAAEYEAAEEIEQAAQEALAEAREALARADSPD